MSDVEGATASFGDGVPPLSQFHHVGLTVRDVEQSEAWYREVLGFQRAFVEPHHGGKGYAVVMIRPGTTIDIGLDHHDDHDGSVFNERRTGLDHLSLAVEQRADLDRWTAHLDHHGVERGEVVEGAIGEHDYAVVCFRDPDGIALELIWTR